MTREPLTARGRLSRRSALGLLGAASLAAGGAVALTGDAHASSGPGAAPAGPPPAALLPGGAYDKFVSGLAAQDMFSGTVLLARHGKSVLVRSYHDADKAKHVPNQTDTSFYLASVTKFLTGAAVTQLAAQGKVDFYATLGTYLDGFPSDIADHVTVHNLLTHTSGFPGNQKTGAPPSWPTPTAAFEGTLALLRTQKLAFTPGTDYTYSNANYFLAGAIIAAASGQAYWDYMPQHIFGPAGMTNSGFYSAQQWLTDPRIAHNYGPPVPNGQRQDITSQAAAAATPNGWNGAGGAFCSAPDLLHFALALTDGTLLPRGWGGLLAGGRYPVSPEQHYADQPPGITLIGYGPEERMIGGQRAYGHTGALEIRVPGSSQPGGGSADLSIYPDLDVIAVVLSNYYLYPGLGGFLAKQDQIITQGAS
jgi:CubicO group peptidase (beta-lactamase class C family)